MHAALSTPTFQQRVGGCKGRWALTFGLGEYIMTPPKLLLFPVHMRLHHFSQLSFC